MDLTLTIVDFLVEKIKVEQIMEKDLEAMELVQEIQKMIASCNWIKIV
jgi:hypothetical protein